MELLQKFVECIPGDCLFHIADHVPIPMQVGGEFVGFFIVGVIVVAVEPVGLDVFLFGFLTAILTAVVLIRELRVNAVFK